MKKGRKRLRLAAGEIEILEMLWREKTATISQAHKALDREVGYTTVQTRLNRLVEKGLVKKSGSHPANYKADIKPEEVSQQDLDVLVKSVSGGHVVPLVAHLVKDRKLTDDEIRELKQLIRDAEKQNAKPTDQEDQ